MIVQVKQLYLRKDNPSKGFTFMVCLDGSDKAYKGLDVYDDDYFILFLVGEKIND